jgi:hypothetical protein
MEKVKFSGFKKKAAVGFILILWVVTAWLLYPLMTTDTGALENANEYIYRFAVGIAIMIIMFGKTIFDLIFPQPISRKMPLINTVFLTLYCVAIASGIIIVIAKMIALYLKRGDTLFQI